MFNQQKSVAKIWKAEEKKPCFSGDNMGRDLAKANDKPVFFQRHPIFCCRKLEFIHDIFCVLYSQISYRLQVASMTFVPQLFQLFYKSYLDILGWRSDRNRAWCKLSRYWQCSMFKSGTLTWACLRKFIELYNICLF